MCDLAAATNPASASLDGWNCSEGIPSPSVVCVWGGVSCNSDSSVTSIRLQYGKLEGTLPDSIGTLTSLESLLLTGNRLNGIVPTSMGEMKMLTQLALVSNKFTGIIPSSLCNLHLQYLNINYYTSMCFSACLSSVPNLYRFGISACTSSPTGNILICYLFLTHSLICLIYLATPSKPTALPSAAPSKPTKKPTASPSMKPTTRPSRQPSSKPTARPSAMPSKPTRKPTAAPSKPTGTTCATYPFYC